MRRCGVEVVVEFLNVFAVITLTVREAEKPLFQNRILPVPECQTQTETLIVVAQAGNAIFAPTIGTAARLVVTEIIPGSPVWAVILTNRSPLALAQVGAPAPPMCPPAVSLFQSFCFLHEVMRCSPSFRKFDGSLGREFSWKGAGKRRALIRLSSVRVLPGLNYTDAGG